ncbi:TPA: CRISPR-associated endonuclease Cas2 [Mannheimia haemolytica]
MNYLIGYDITEPKRLQKVHQRLIKYATAIQYSVFLFEGTSNGLKNCLDDILEILDKKEDDLRVYIISKGLNQWQFGKPIFPEGIIWTGFPFNSV